MIQRLSRLLRRLAGRIFRGRFPELYSTLDDPIEVPIQVAAYQLVTDRYILPGDKVLDVGSGLAYGLKIIAGKAVYVAGIDIDEKAVLASQSIIEEGSRIKAISHYNGIDLPYPDKFFDVVTCIDVIEHVPAPQPFLLELKRVASRIVFVSTPNRRPENTLPDGKPRNYWHLREWTPDEFQDLLDSTNSADLDWNFINGAWAGPFSYSTEPLHDTQAISPAIFINSNG